MNRVKRQSLSEASQKPKSSQINDFLWNFGSWLTSEDQFSDVIISSRIRLARNIKGYPFPSKAGVEDLSKLIRKVRRACGKCQTLNNANYFELENLSTWDSKYFVERRLASPQFIDNSYPSLLVVGHNEALSIMVNEEDHLRIQCIEAGLGINSAWKNISRVDDELEEFLNFSYSNKFGYLTACPTNIGTGLRVSIFVHLPALSMRDEVSDALKELHASEIAVRGFYGEGSEPIGNIFQVSNQITLGRAENNVIDRLVAIARQLVNKERKARERQFVEDRVQVEDAVFRALGVLRNARIISSLEAMDLLSMVRLGIELGLVKEINRLAVNQLMVLVQPAHLQKIYDRDLSPEERDIVRAEFIRENFEV